MMLLPIPWKGKLKLLVILENDNIERMKEHDCAEIFWSNLGPYYRRLPDTITIGYVTPEELEKVKQWAAEGNMVEAVKLITGGFRFRPEKGDHDQGPTPLVQP